MAFLYLVFSFAIGVNFVFASPVPQSYVASSNSAVVDLGYATYEGTALDAGMNEFLGMRYAAAPLGDLRWRAPQNPVQEDQPQTATAVSL